MKALWLLVAVMCISLTTSCGNHRKSADWLTSDDVHIAIDETFRPIMEEEVFVFGANYPEATMKPVYCSENEAIRLLVSDSLRIAVTTRPLNDAERKIVESHTLTDRADLVATDAMALVVNKSNPDSLITLDEVRGIVTGKITRWEQLSHSSQKGELKLVFDDSGSSTVRYMQDSLCLGQKFQGNLYAQGSNESVLETVKEDPSVIGVVGANWLKDAKDSALSSFDNLDVRVMWVSRFNAPNEIFRQPFQYYIATGEYPLLRSVYVITTDPRVTSMVKNFFFFLTGQRGQLIICNSSQLLPRLPVQIKEVSMPE